LRHEQMGSRLSQFAVRTVARQFLHMLCRNRWPFSFDGAGFDDNHIDTKRTDFITQAIGEALYGKLGSMIPGPQQRPHFPANGGDVDNSSRALLAHDGQRRLNHVRYSKDIHLELVAGCIQGYFFNRAVEAIARIVDQDINTPALRDNLRHKGINTLAFRQVESVHMSPLLFEITHRIKTTRTGMYLVALSEKAKDGLFANAGRRSGDDDDLFHARVHIFLLFLSS